MMGFSESYAAWEERAKIADFSPEFFASGYLAQAERLAANGDIIGARAQIAKAVQTGVMLAGAAEAGNFVTSQEPGAAARLAAFNATGYAPPLSPEAVAFEERDRRDTDKVLTAIARGEDPDTAYAVTTVSNALEDGSKAVADAAGKLLAPWRTALIVAGVLALIGGAVYVRGVS